MSRLNMTLPNGTTKYATFAAIAIVVVTGIGVMPSFWPGWVLPLIGAMLGLFSVKDAKGFLLAGLALIAAKWGLQFLPMVGGYTEAIADQLVILVAPAMLIVSVRNIFDQLKG